MFEFLPFYFSSSLLTQCRIHHELSRGLVCVVKTRCDPVVFSKTTMSCETMESNSGELKMKSAGVGFWELLFGPACQHQRRVDFLTRRL